MSTTVLDLSVQPVPEVLGTTSQLTAKVRRYCKAIRASDHSFRVLHKSIVALEKLIFDEGWSDLDVALTLAETADQRAELNNAYCTWETQLESEYAQDILAGRETTLDNYHLNQRFEELVQRELSLLDGSKPERILFMGSGPLPISAFHIHKVTNRRVDCVDHSASAVEISRQVIEKLEL